MHRHRICRWQATGIIAPFSRKSLRDPDSGWLRDYPCDVPCDDPSLFEALVALRNE
jgi:hypothetical protein